METFLIIGTVVATCAILTLILALVGIVLIEMLSDHAAAVRRWLRSFKPRRRLPTGGQMLAA